MDIGKLPTDNLYKFIAIGGIMLFIIGLGFTYAYKFQVKNLQLEKLNRIRQESISFGPLSAKESSIIRKMDYINKIAIRRFEIKNINYPDSIKDYKYTFFYTVDSIKYSRDEISYLIDSIIELESPTGLTKKQYDALDKLYESIIERSTDSTEAFSYSIMDFKKLQELKPLKFEYESLIIDLETVREEIETNKENLKYTTNGIQIEEDNLQKQSIKYYLVLYLGIGLFIAGLLFWYIKTQMILDKKLKNESNYDKLFEYRYLALKEINLIYYRVQPKRVWKEMDNHEAYQYVTLNQAQIYNLVNNYLNEHSAILDSEDLKVLKELEVIANKIQFEVDNKDFSVTSKGVELSKEVINKLKSILDSMKNKFDKEFK